MAFEKAILMGAVFVLDEVKEMNRKIDQILEILRIQNNMICHLLPQSAKLRADLNALARCESKLGAINDSIFVIKELIRFKRPPKAAR